VQTVAHPSPLVLEAEVLDRVAAAKAGDPLAPVLIVVPSKELARHLAATHRRAAAVIPNGVRLEVEDTGPGVAEEVRARLFEPFVTTKEVGKGTGLGLAVCRGLVEAAGGTITLDEGYAEGARFVLELPRAEGATSSRRIASVPSAGETP